MQKPEPEGLRTVEFQRRDEAEAYLSQVANSIRSVSFAGPEDEFSIAYAGGSIGTCSMHRGSHSALSYRVVESGEFHFARPLRSGLHFGGAPEALALSSADAGLLVPPSASGKVTLGDQFAGISLIVPAVAVTRYASRLDPSAKPLDTSAVSVAALKVDEPVVAALVRNMTSVFHEMMTLGQSGLGAVAAASLDELLLALMSTLVASRIGSHGPATPPDSGSLIVQRARELIRAQADEPMRMSELAHGLGVGLRSLQQTFRREVGCSPRAFLMQCRIERARERLLAATDESKVAAIALDSGFTDLSHFSRRYREAFGELPSETLQRRRKS